MSQDVESKEVKVGVEGEENKPNDKNEDTDGKFASSENSAPDSLVEEEELKQNGDSTVVKTEDKCDDQGKPESSVVEEEDEEEKNDGDEAIVVSSSDTEAEISVPEDRQTVKMPDNHILDLVKEVSEMRSILGSLKSTTLNIEEKLEETNDRQRHKILLEKEKRLKLLEKDYTSLMKEKKKLVGKNEGLNKSVRVLRKELGEEKRNRKRVEKELDGEKKLHRTTKSKLNEEKQKHNTTRSKAAEKLSNVQKRCKKQVEESRKIVQKTLKDCERNLEEVKKSCEIRMEEKEIEYEKSINEYKKQIISFKSKQNQKEEKMEKDFVERLLHASSGKRLSVQDVLDGLEKVYDVYRCLTVKARRDFKDDAGVSVTKRIVDDAVRYAIQTIEGISNHIHLFLEDFNRTFRDSLLECDKSVLYTSFMEDLLYKCIDEEKGGTGTGTGTGTDIKEEENSIFSKESSDLKREMCVLLLKMKMLKVGNVLIYGKEFEGDLSFSGDEKGYYEVDPRCKRKARKIVKKEGKIDKFQLISFPGIINLENGHILKKCLVLI